MSESDGSSRTRVSRLDGGLRVVTESDPTSRTIAVGVWVGVGNRDEPAPIAGVSHFLEHLLFRGSTSRSAREIAEGVDARGGDLNAFTAKEYTAFHSRMPATELDFALGTLLDVIVDPVFDGADVDAERQVILEELAWSKDTPDDVVHSTLAESLFPSHPLGWEVLGTTESVKAVTVADIREFHDRWYRKANLVVSVVGPIDHDTVVESVDAALTALPIGQRPVRSAPSEPVRPTVGTDRSIEQAHVALGWRGHNQDHPDRHALAVANQLLGGGWSSRLFQEVRERRGMAYTVFSSAGSFTDSGSMSVYAGTSPDRVGELLEVIEEELADLTSNGPSPREVEVARGGFEGATIIGLEDIGSRMTRLATSLTLRDRIIEIDDYLDAIRAVERDDVQRVLADVVGPGGALSIVGPAASLTGVAGLDGPTPATRLRS